MKAKALRCCWVTVHRPAKRRHSERSEESRRNRDLTREVSPDHRMTQRALARIVHRLDPLVMQERPQPLPMFVQFPARASHFFVSALHSAQQQTLHLAADRPHATHQRRPRNPAIPIIGPMLEQLAGGRALAFAQPLPAESRAILHARTAYHMSSSKTPFMSRSIYPKNGPRL
jgi:hypothetical protein